jgi:hypothetical protein
MCYEVASLVFSHCNAILQKWATCSSFLRFNFTKDNLHVVVRLDSVQKLWKGDKNLLVWRISLCVLFVHKENIKYIHRTLLLWRQ